MYATRTHTYDAFWMTQEKIWDNSEWPQWLHAAWNMFDYESGAVWRGSGSMKRKEDGKTPEGEGGVDYLMVNSDGKAVQCYPNHWIVRNRWSGSTQVMYVYEFEKKFESME